MTRLKLFVADNCPKCPSAKKVFNEVIEELRLKEGEDYSILNIDEGDNLITALQYQIASTPSIVVDNEVVSVGEVPSKRDLLERLSR